MYALDLQFFTNWLPVCTLHPSYYFNRKDVQKTMGVLQYQRAFVPHFSTLARPIFATLKKGTPFVWTPEARTALDKIINIITTDPSLPQPNPDKPFELEIDASAYAT